MLLTFHGNSNHNEAFLLRNVGDNKILDQANEVFFFNLTR